MKSDYFYIGIIQVFVAIGAIPAGLSMIADPTGDGVGMDTDILLNSPFKDFLIPGIFLFCVLGLVNIFAAYFSFKKEKPTGLIGIILGFILVFWICIQIYFIGISHFLQIIFLLVGITEVILSYRLISVIKSQ